MANYHAAPIDSDRQFAKPNSVLLDKISGIIAEHPADLDHRLTSLSSSLGFDFFSLVTARSVANRRSPLTIRSSYQASWKVRYQELAYYEIDPIVLLAPTARRPFMWGRKGDLTGISFVAERLLNEGRSYCIRFGISVPTHGPNGEFTLLTMVTGRTQRTFDDLVCNSHTLLWMISPLVHEAAFVLGLPSASSLREAPSERVELSDQQKRCLALTLQGKTSDQIAEIMSRSRATVEYHLQKAMRQFRVRTKIAAAIRALKAGIIVA
jgi:DNA-binding CsgD family transcriptional regulator